MYLYFYEFITHWAFITDVNYINGNSNSNSKGKGS